LAPASLLIPSRGRSPEKIRRLDTEDPCQPVHNVDPGSIDASLERTDVGTVDLGAVRQFLLRQALGLTEFPQIDRQYLSYLHGRESTVLKSISPRSILYKRLSTAEFERFHDCDWPVVAVRFMFLAVVQSRKTAQSSDGPNHKSEWSL
jgi:hypothetical protein